MKWYKVWYVLGLMFMGIFFLSTLTVPSLMILLLSVVCFILCAKYYKE